MHLKRTLAVLASAAVVSACGGRGSEPSGVESVTAGAASSKVRLGKHDRELLAKAKAEGRARVNLLIGTESGSAPAVARGLAAIGATVRFRDDDLGYIRALVPVEKAEAAAALAGVKTANVDELVPLDLPRPAATDGGSLLVDPPGPATPVQNPYMPTRDIGAPQFVQANPTFDGRGVVVGIVDSGIDLLTPELQTAKNLAGQTVPKIVNWVSFTDPLSGEDPSWIDMAQQVRVAGGSFTARVGSATAAYAGVPADGTYRFGAFREAALPNNVNDEYKIGCGVDVNRNGVCGEAFGVLWNTASNRVWVDTDADRSFADETSLTDFAVAREYGLFGVDNPATATRESVPFVVQTNGRDKFVNVGIVTAAHGTHVAGIVAGKDFFGGAFDGAAPEAQLVSIQACVFGQGCSSYALVEGMIYAVKQSGANVINMSIGGLPPLNDGSSTRALIYDRIIEQWSTQIFLSAGNSGPGLNTVGDPAVASKALALGAYVTSDTWMSNYGSAVATQEGLFTFSSRGPAENGGFKPNLVAPGAAVSTIPGWQTDPPLAYRLPPGYGMFNGTSMAAPMAAGGTALLISAAKQAGAQWQPAQLRQALRSSARFLKDFGAHEQGAGLVQIPAAWDLLRTNIKTVEILSAAPVNTTISPLVGLNSGPGIYQREGWAAGNSEKLTIALMRTKGGARPVSYDVSWIGNDGTFSTAATSVALPLNVPVALGVTVAPATVGVHSAILVLDDPATAGLDYEIMNTVVAAAQVGSDYSVTFPATEVGRAQMKAFYVEVPEGTPALRFDVTNVTGRVKFLRYTPWGMPYNGENNTVGFQTDGAQARTLLAPQPGVWEVTVEGSRSAVTGANTPVELSSFGVTGSHLGVSIDPAAWNVEAAANVPATQAFNFTNQLAAFTGGARGGPLASAFAARPTITPAAQQSFEFQVPSGTSRVVAQIGGAADLNADLDLYLYWCPAPDQCLLAAAGTSSTSNEIAAFNGPPPGTWKAVVDPYAIPSGSTAYDYTDRVFHAMFSSVGVADATNVLRAATTPWSAVATVTPVAAPPPGRFLQGSVEVVSAPPPTATAAPPTNDTGVVAAAPVNVTVLP